MAGSPSVTDPAIPPDPRGSGYRHALVGVDGPRIAPCFIPNSPYRAGAIPDKILRLGLLLLGILSIAMIIPPGTAGVIIDTQGGDLIRGDTILLSGTVFDTPTIAVFLFVTGPGLPPQGATLENLNLPTGQGYVTTAPVLPDGSWQYRWNTGNIIGKVLPGEYHVYAVSAPVNYHRIGSANSAFITVRIMEPNTPAPIPAGPVLPLAAFFLASLIVIPGSGPASGRQREVSGTYADRPGDH